MLPMQFNLNLKIAYKSYPANDKMFNVSCFNIFLQLLCIT